MNNPHLLLTRVPRAYCKFKSEFFCFGFFSALIRFDSRRKRKDDSLLMVSNMDLKTKELRINENEKLKNVV